mgnify:CR=1 FL=1
MNVTPNTDKRVAQLIDANLDRAREGIRVIEDWCRFGLCRKDLIETLKSWRQELGVHHKDEYKEARSTLNDQGAGLSHPAQNKRTKPLEIVFANFARVQEALRVLEEFTRHSNTDLSKLSAKIRYEIYDLETTVSKASKTNLRLKKLSSCKLCLITSPHPDLMQIVCLALDAGVEMVQYRGKEGEDLEKLSQAKELVSICKKHDALFIVNDRVDIALAVDADGVHLGQDDLPAEIARQIIGPDKILGISAHSISEALKAEENGCNYIGIGPIFSSKTKLNIQSLGIENLLKISSATQLPWFAIGGINCSSLPKLIALKDKKIAVIEAIMNSNDPTATTKKLLEQLQ